MSYVLSGRSLEVIQGFLRAPARDYDADSAAPYPDPYNKILSWALDPELGGLPRESAKAFASWLSNAWADWTEEPDTTVKGVLEGAVIQWCGGRVMPS
jgi:hypothetical protein